MSAGAKRITVVSEPTRVELRLRELGLSREYLLDSLSDGLASAALCSVLHPTNFAGLTLWAEAIRSLRDRLITKEGWRSDNAYNLPTVVRSDHGMAIAVVRGGEGTGDPKAKNVSTQYPRGPVMMGRVEINGVLPYDHLPPEYFEDQTEAAVPTWLLMHRKIGSELMCELSFPTSINKSGFVEGWAERICLPPIPLDPTRLRALDDNPINPEVKVKRRA
jgi:hypothetical protein